MRSPGQGLLRGARGVVLALCCLALGLWGHGIGGGQTPPAGVVLAAAGALAAGFVLWADRQRRYAELTAAAAATQVALHVVFSAAAGVFPAAGGHAAHPGAAGGRMLLGHLVAAALMAWVLARGESALWRLARLLGRVLLPRPVGAPRPLPRLRPDAPVGDREPVRVGLLLATAHGRRGPPRPISA